MTRWMVRTLWLSGAVGLAIGALILLQRRDDGNDDDEAIAAPSRVRADSNGSAYVLLDTADRRRIGLRVAPLRAAAASAELRLSGELVAEAGSITSVRAPVGGRLTPAADTKWPVFGDRIATGASLGQVSDALPLTAPRSGVVTRVGAQPGEIVEAGQLLLEITNYDHPVVRLAWGPEAPRPPGRLHLAVPLPGGAEQRIGARLVGPALEADPVTRLPAFLYRAEAGWPGARPGLAVVGLVQIGESAPGVLVPEAALVQWEGLVWAYALAGPGRFERRRVPTERPSPGGLLAGGEWSVEDSVVVQGAQQLLSEEFRARITVGDEQGE
jgi:hypothetical protein